MGIYDRPYYRDDDRPTGPRFSGPQTMVGRLIVVNVVCYLAILFTKQGLQSSVEAWMSVRSDVAVQPLLWWKFLTYGFAHDSNQIMHILGNMFVLFMFGREVEAIYGPVRFLRNYLIALVLGGIVWTFSAYGLGQMGSMVGASGAVTTILVLFCLHFPKRMVYLMGVLPIPAWALGAMYVLGDLMGLVSQKGQVAYQVHLVGALYALAYFRFGRVWDAAWPSGGRSWKRWFSGRRLKVYQERSEPTTRGRRQTPSASQLAGEADRVLEKLHREGEASLTAAERKVLETYSREVRNRR